MEERINHTTDLVDTNTGEIIHVQSGTKIVPPDRQKQKKEYAIKANQSFTEKNERYSDTLAVRGNFFVSLCQETELYWQEITEPTLGKLIYLATFIDKNNCICYDGGWNTTEEPDGGKVHERIPKPMTKEDIQKTLNVSAPTFRAFWKECMDKELIIEKNAAYYLSKEMFRFCDNTGISKRKTRMVKMFKHAIRYMYENTDERSKKTLIHLYRLIPFINLTHNGLCSNPFESDKKNIRPLPLAKICEMFGIDPSHQTRFLKKLKKLRFIDKQGNECSVIRYSWLYYDKDIYWITINPQFYSGYISEEDMVAMVEEFKLPDGGEVHYDKGLD